MREDEYVSVINPHLNRYWHEEGFLPAIDPLQRQIDREETLKAFIYAIGKDLFFLQDTDDEGEARKTWYFMYMGRSKAVRSCGKLIGNSYTDLFRSIPFNGQIKATILALASTGMKKVKGSKTAEELKAGILDDAFIKDLAQIIAEECR